MKLTRLILTMLVIALLLTGCFIFNKPTEQRNYLGENVYDMTTGIPSLNRFTTDNNKPELFTPELPVSGSLDEGKLLFDNSTDLNHVCSSPENIIIITKRASYVINKKNLKMTKMDNVKYGVYTKDNSKCFAPDTDKRLACWDTDGWKIVWKSDLIVDYVIPFKRDLLAYGSNFIALVDAKTGKTLWSLQTKDDKVYNNGIYSDKLIFNYGILRQKYLLDTKRLKLSKFNEHIEDACIINNELWISTYDGVLLKANSDNGNVLTQFDYSEAFSDSLRMFIVYSDKLKVPSSRSDISLFDPNNPRKQTKIAGTINWYNRLYPLESVYISSDNVYRFEKSTITNTNQIGDYLWFADGRFIIANKKDGLYLFTVGK